MFFADKLGELVRAYRKLVAWQRGMDIVESVYRITRGFPTDEKYVLVPQLRRAAISIPSNIAEGNDRDSVLDHRRFITMARSSVSEIETDLEIALRLRYIRREPFIELMNSLAEETRILLQLRRSVVR